MLLGWVEPRTTHLEAEYAVGVEPRTTHLEAEYAVGVEPRTIHLKAEYGTRYSPALPTLRLSMALGWQKLWMLPALAIFMKCSPVRPLR